MIIENNLAFSDIENIITAKFCLVVFLAVGFYAIFYKLKNWLFLLITGFLMAAAYYFLFNDLKLLLWGLAGDEITIAAMYNTFSKISFFSDFAYHSLPPFYPPLFFWAVSLFGKFMDWNGVAMAKFGAAATFAFFPASIYLIQRVYWRREIDKPHKIASLLAPLLIMLFVNIDEIIGKPYELIAVTLAIFWTMFIYLELRKETFGWKKIIFFGFWAGIIFMTYYLWLVFAAITLAILSLGIKKEKQYSFYLKLFLVFITSLFFSLPYLGPLLYAYAVNGTENWQAAFFIPDNIIWRTPFFDLLNWRALLMLGGFISIIYFRREEKNKPLIALLITAYAWWLIGLVTLYFFQVPMQEFRGFFYFMPSILAIGLSFGLERLYNILGEVDKKDLWRKTLLSIGLIYFASNFIFGSFVDDPVVQKRLVKSKVMPQRIENLINFLKTDSKNNKLTVNSLPEISAFVPINNFVYFNQHNNHPAANFSSRFNYLRLMAEARDENKFYNLAIESPYGKIERFILYNYQGKSYFYFHLDSIINGIKEEQIIIPDYLITEKYFKKIYNRDDYVIWEIK